MCFRNSIHGEPAVSKEVPQLLNLKLKTSIPLSMFNSDRARKHSYLEGSPLIALLGGVESLVGDVVMVPAAGRTLLAYNKFIFCNDIYFLVIIQEYPFA